MFLADLLTEFMTFVGRNDLVNRLKLEWAGILFKGKKFISRRLLVKSSRAVVWM